MYMAGCASVITDPENNWTYRGQDPALQSPPRVARGELTTSEWLEKMRISHAAWGQERQVALERAKADCTQETGQSATPGFWFGHARAFASCMRGRGWA